MAIWGEKAFRAGYALGLVLFCGSCSRSFEVQPSGFATDVRLTFSEQIWFVSRPKQACVSRLTVSEEKWPSRASTSIVWSIKAKGRCTVIEGVDVGHVPAGFSEEVNKLPLEAGRMYGASANADPYGGGSMPWFVCQRVPETVAWKNDYRLNEPSAQCRR